MNSRSPISAQANAISEPPESQHQVKPDHNNNIVRRANNRSLSSSLRRLITITFTNGGSSRKKKKCRASNIKQNHNNIDIDDNNIIGSNNNNINGDNNSIGDANSLAAINNNSLAAAGSSSNSSKKQTRDKISIYKHNNDYLTRTNTLFGNKRGQFSLVGTDSLSLQAPTLATSKSDNNKNGNAKISFSFSRSSNQLNNNSNSDNNSNKVGRTIFRRSSQPPISNFNDPSTTLSQSKTQAATTGSDTLSLGGRRIIKKTNYSINSAALSSSWVLTDDDGEENADSYVEKHETNGVGLMTNSENKKEKISDNNYSKGQKQKVNSKSNKEQQNGKGAGQFIECPLCVFPITEPPPYLASCKHKVCLECLQRYITTEINHSRLNITCPVCSEPIHPNTIKNILQNQDYYLKYESFMLRRVLAGEPDARWCPAPDCGYVVLANGCASCPRLVCGRDGCKTSFCYHCKQEWHPNQTCSAANIQRNKGQMAQAYQHELLYNEDLILSATSNAAGSVGTGNNRKSSKSSQVTGSIKADDIKECPVCTSRIVKMNDGSCNHMTCSICETEFCWLCMKEISDLHYFSPSGCTFWGKKPWSRKKKLLWQLGMLVGAPICIILIAGIAVPAIVIGIPVWAARKLHNRLERKPSISRYRKNAIITGGVILSFLISPIISAIALSFGVPILLGYVYGVVPLSLCRSSGGCLSRAASLENLQNNIQQRVQAVSPFNLNLGGNSNNNNNTPYNNKDGISIDSRLATSITSHKLNGSVGEVTNVGNTTIGDLSIGETSIYMSNISLETNSIGLSAGPTGSVVRCSDDRESASNAALAGSIYSGNNASNNLNDDGNSIRALAGSIISKRSAGTSGGGYTLIPAEVHSTTQEVAPSTIAIPGTNMDTK